MLLECPSATMDKGSSGLIGDHGTKQLRDRPDSAYLSPPTSPGIRAVRSRRPTASELVSESLPALPWRNIGACRSLGKWNTRLVSQISSGDAWYRPRPASPVDLLANPERPVAARRATPFRRKGDDATFVLRRSCSIPGLSCVWDVHASLGICRSLLPLAFNLEKSSEI